MTDTSQMTVHELLDYADAHPDEVQQLLDEEKAGPNRSTAVSGLEARLVLGGNTVSDEPEVTNGEAEEPEEDEHEGEEGQDYIIRDGEELRLDDGSDEYAKELAEKGVNVVDPS